MLNLKTKKPGKPADLLPAGGRQVRVYLGQPDVEKAKKLGNGNLSLGIRRALEEKNHEAD